MSLFEVLGTGVVAGVVVQIIQFGRDYFSRLEDSNRRARAHALKISNQLKTFSLNCQAAIDEFNIQERTSDPNDVVPPDMPEIDFLSLISEADDVDKVLLTRIVDLDLRRTAEGQHLALAYQLYLDYDDRVDADVKRLKFLVKECSEVASALRARYGLGGFPDLLQVVRDA